MYENPVLEPLARKLIANASEHNPLSISKMGKKASEMVEPMEKNKPLRLLVSSSQGNLTEEMLADVIKQLNMQQGVTK